MFPLEETAAREGGQGSKKIYLWDGFEWLLLEVKIASLIDFQMLIKINLFQRALK